MSIDYPEKLDRDSTFFRLIIVIPILVGHPHGEHAIGKSQNVLVMRTDDPNAHA